MDKKVVAVVSYRFDKDYLEDLKKNISPLVDEVIVSYDIDGLLWKDEGKYRSEMIKKAEKAGADYVLVIDPDERLEKRAVKTIRKLIGKYDGQKVLFKFNYRELYQPNKYRIDGIWGRKERVMVFPLLPDNKYSTDKLHTPHQPINDDFKTIDTGLNVYHLKHIKAELRKNRKEIYNKLDPDHKYNGSAGYDYLDDETGMQLEKIKFSRRYLPKYRDYKVDEGLFKFVNQGK